MEQQTKRYSHATLEKLNHILYNYVSDLVGMPDDKKKMDGCESINSTHLAKEIATLKLLNAEAIEQVLDRLEQNIEIRKELIEAMETYIPPLWNKDISIKKANITDYGNYYIVNFIYDKALKRRNHGYAIFDKTKSLLQAGTYVSNDTAITPLDENNFLVSSLKFSHHYRIVKDKKAIVSQEEVLSWYLDEERESFTTTEELLEKGLIIIHRNDGWRNDGSRYEEKKDFLYSFKEGKFLTQGFDQIEAEEIINGKKKDYVKDYGCLKATSVISSNIEGAEQITNEVIGKLNFNGKLMECMFNMNTGTTYSIYESNNIDKLVSNVQKELNTQVLEQKERKEQAKKTYQKIFSINSEE